MNNQNSDYKNNGSMSLSSIFQFNSLLPMTKENNLYKNLIPKLSLKVAPNHTKNLSNDDDKIDINNVYSLNRISDNQATEGEFQLHMVQIIQFQKKRKIEKFNLSGLATSDLVKMKICLTEIK